MIFCLAHFVYAQAQKGGHAIAYDKIGKLVWQNESGKSIEKLTWWNQGEEFASLGIGHFIWFAQNQKKNFEETFPDLLLFLWNCGANVPEWLGSPPLFIPCPWPTRENFFAEFNRKKMIELRDLLSQTVALQMRFIAERAQKKLADLIDQSKPKDKQRIQSIINDLLQTPNGLYALIDYINFKGDGVNHHERYNGQGWGLMQVLQSMDYKKNNVPLITQFADEAKKILTLRVKNSPKERNEQKFLPGWINRINTYTQIF
jgi:hypothetical protein